MNATQYPIHPLAAAFPEMAPEEFADLKASIKDHGLRHKIVILDGQVLDGRNRYKACLELGIPPIFRDYDHMIDGDVPVSFVADENLNRRNLTTGQRAAIAAELEPFFAAAIAAEKQRKADELAAKKAAKEKKPEPKKEDTSDATAEALETKLAAIHKVDKTSSVLKGAVAAHNGAGLDENPFEEGHPARDLWKRGWEAETARMIQTNVDDDDDLPITSKQTETVVVDDSKAPTTAAGKAAAVTGVSDRSVEHAKKLKQESPKEFEKVKQGEKSLHQAKKDAEQTKQDAKMLGESVSPYRAECADLLEAGLGEDFSEAIRNVTVLKTASELDAFMKLSAVHQKEVVPFVVKGWKVADAVKFLRGEFDAGTTVGELMSYCNAKGGTSIVEIGQFEISIVRK